MKDEGKNKGTGVKSEMSFYHTNGDLMQDVNAKFNVVEVKFWDFKFVHPRCVIDIF
jgi:hypothetical protein